MGITERKVREKEHRKEEILDAAKKVFFEKGLSAATMDEIAEAAELSKGTLYLYYKSKEDMYLGVMMRGMEELYEDFERIGTSSVSTLHKIMELGDVYRKYFDKHRKFFRMIHFLQSPQFHKQVSDEMKKTCDMETQRVWNVINSILQTGMDEGLLRPNYNPMELGVILWSNMNALMLRIDNEGDKWKKRFNIDLEHTLSVSTTLLFESILTTRGRTEYAALANK
ncbi:MAG: TetR/AcrR family transcriptional regulator [Ignavibacteriae bacterium]|nr:MAG: TetR/AcrR family transcriptional regulator [Ignavibacteriota bacterium]